MHYTENTTPRSKRELINLLAFENQQLKEEIQLRESLSTPIGFYNYYFKMLKTCYTRQEAFHKTNQLHKSLFGKEKTTQKEFFSENPIKLKRQNL